MSIFQWTRRFLVISAVLLCAMPAVMADQFVIKKIQINGLHQLSRSAVIGSIPVKTGQTFTDSMSGKIITSLYKLGYFSNVSINQTGDVLIINVTERPTIGLLKVTGNKSIDKKQLSPVLEQAGIVEGRFYNPSAVQQLVEGLKQQYLVLGYHAASVDLSVKKMTKSRVEVDIKIVEGPAATLKSIEIIGAPEFSNRQLKKSFADMKTGLTSFISHNNRYSEQKLDVGLQNLQNFFLDRGYIKYKMISKKVDITANHKGVNVQIKVAPGGVYKINKITLSSDIKNNPELVKMITVKPGDIFSRDQVVKNTKDVGDYFANRGFAYAHVDVSPTLNDANHTVALNFILEKGKLTYVRRIHFTGNESTQDRVLRHQLRQMEAAPFSLKNINESKRNIALLPYFKDVDMKIEPVDGHADQVDLNYSAEEVKAGAATVNAGYSDEAGFLYGVSLTEPNFMGSGKMVSLSFQQSDYWSQYSFSYLNPFYKPNGISRGFNLTASRYKPSKIDLDNYDMDMLSASFNYSIPLSENIRFSWGGGYEYADIDNLPDTVSPSVSQYVANNPSPYNNLTLNFGLSYMGLNRAYFPTDGTTSSIGVTASAPVFDSSTPYYLLKMQTNTYKSLGGGFVFNPHSIFAFGQGYDGDSELPFFKNIYAGGIDSLPGYTSGGLGPYYKYSTLDSSGNVESTGTSSLGGNLEAIVGVNLIFPNPFPDTVRTSLLIDAGNVFQTSDLVGSFTSSSVTGDVTQESAQLKNMRITAGVMVQWRTFMPLNFSLAYPLNKKDGDLTQPFSFSASTAL